MKHLKERTPEKLQLFRKEIELMRCDKNELFVLNKLKILFSKDPHPNICMVLGVCDEGNQVYLGKKENLSLESN